MLSPIRSLCFNDDHETFTIVLPSQYRVFKCDPFGMIFSRELEDLSLWALATFDGYRFLAITGSPSAASFNTQCIRVFDHKTGTTVFDHAFEDHILNIRLGDDLALCCFHCYIQGVCISMGQILFKVPFGANVHVPMAISPDSKSMITPGPNSNEIAHFWGLKTSINRQVNKVADEAVAFVQFSRDGKMYATIPFVSKSIKIWDSTQKLEIVELVSDGIVQSIDFTEDNKTIATVSSSGQVRVYTISTFADDPIQPNAVFDLSSHVIMPRIIWLDASTLCVISLTGDLYRIPIQGNSDSYETTTFLKRGE